MGRLVVVWLQMMRHNSTKRQNFKVSSYTNALNEFVSTLYRKWALEIEAMRRITCYDSLSLTVSKCISNMRTKHSIMMSMFMMLTMRRKTLW